MVYFDIFIVLLFSILFWYSFHDRRGYPTDWPIVGMFPALLRNVHRIHAYFIEILEKCNLTFYFKGPWFTKMQIIATIDPAIVHHVMSKNFGNYPKGTKLKEILDVLGDGIFNTDFMVWQYHRKMAQSFLHHPKFHQFLVKKTWEKVENGLVPVLDHVSKHARVLDLQDVFTRFTFDTICTIIMDHDPKSLSIDLPFVPSTMALDDLEEVVFYRHVMPPFVWKFLRWLNIGVERKYKKAWQTLDSFIYKCIELKSQELRKSKQLQPPKQKDDEVSTEDLLTLYLKNVENQKGLIRDHSMKFLRDTVLNFFIAGRDTTSATLSWFFYLLSKNPQVVSKIKMELNTVTIDKNDVFSDVSNNLVYLHAALCETLRLYPPVVFEAKSPLKPDTLPSGHLVDQNTQIIFNMYAMGRMKCIWGEDCYEFKPERWISEKGRIRHEPSYKFFAFNAGPRTCLGKDMAFTQMKIVAATIINNYVIEAVDEAQVVPSTSIIFHMKNGFKVRVSRCQ